MSNYPAGVTDATISRAAGYCTKCDSELGDFGECVECIESEMSSAEWEYDEAKHEGDL